MRDLCDLGADLRRLHPVRLLHGDVILQGGTYEDLRHEVRTEVLEEFREAIEIRLIGLSGSAFNAAVNSSVKYCLSARPSMTRIPSASRKLMFAYEYCELSATCWPYAASTWPLKAPTLTSTLARAANLLWNESRPSPLARKKSEVLRGRYAM